MLHQVKTTKSDLGQYFRDIQSYIWNNYKSNDQSHESEVLLDLAYDLDYFQPDAKVRSEVNSLIDENKALELIDETLLKLKYSSHIRNS